MYPIVKKIIADNGDAWTTPASTIEAFWSALGAGADGLNLSIYLTKDGEVVCTPAETLSASGGVQQAVIELTLDELQSYDAGKSFRSTVLDDDFQPTGEQGGDYPWQQKAEDYPLKARKHLFHPSLQEVFEIFSRRTDITLCLPGDDYAHWQKLLPALTNLIIRFGMIRKVTLLGSFAMLKRLRKQWLSFTFPNFCLDCRECIRVDDIYRMSTIACRKILVSYETIAAMSEADRALLFSYSRESNVLWRFSSKTMPYAPTQHCIRSLLEWDCDIDAWHSQGVLSARQMLLPNTVLFTEDFSEAEMDQRYWRAGYSHVNNETEIKVIDQRLVIRISEGKAYSGGAAICTLPVRGNFDAEVAFHVENPYQATTFELAAIGIDPGYHHLNNEDLNSRNVNLTFDVHGAPPYASSERDQNDGFRCGWNNSFNFAKIGDPHSERKDAEWLAASANMYNKYGRDVGDGSESNPEGYLRLVRCGSVFNTYYRDKHNAAWVCSGSMLVQNLPADCYLRLAAKHWHKIDPAPHNTIRFWNFTIHQPQL